MSILETLRIALFDLALHKFRSALAVTGIIFGVASVQAMLSISEGARREMLGRIEALGVNNILVRSVKPAGSSSKPASGQSSVAEFGLRRSDLEYVRGHFPFVVRAIGSRDTRLKLYASSGGELDLSVMAVEPEYMDLTRSRLERGRFITWLDQEDCKRVCVLGEDAARKLFSPRDPLEGAVHIGGDWYQAVGILRNNAALKAAGGDEINNCVFIPLETARARYGDISFKTSAGIRENVRVELDAITVELADPGVVIPTARRLENYLAKAHGDRDCEIIVPLELIRQKAETQRIFTIVMASIAGISLLVGGIGIMNIMLANITERRKEIGTRRALGAQRKDIVIQFVFEAATLTSLGGIAGVATGYVLALAVSRYAGWPVVVTPVSIGLSLGISCLVGIIFGLWPAWQAAAVSPIAALRSE